MCLRTAITIISRTHPGYGPTQTAVWLSGAKAPVVYTQLSVARRVTHQAMEGVAPMVGDAAADTTGFQQARQAANPPLRNASIPLQREWQRQVDLLTLRQAPLEFGGVVDQHLLPGEGLGGDQS